jgi:hypothetical protein
MLLAKSVKQCKEMDSFTSTVRLSPCSFILKSKKTEHYTNYSFFSATCQVNYQQIEGSSYKYESAKRIKILLSLIRLEM